MNRKEAVKRSIELREHIERESLYTMKNVQQQVVEGAIEVCLLCNGGEISQGFIDATIEACKRMREEEKAARAADTAPKTA